MRSKHHARRRTIVQYSTQQPRVGLDIIDDIPHRRFRGIEWKGVKIYDLQKVTFSTLFKLYIAGLGVLIPKRYHMLG